jgi:hypothetical protein
MLYEASFGRLSTKSGSEKRREHDETVLYVRLLWPFVIFVKMHYDFYRK